MASYTVKKARTQSQVVEADRCPASGVAAMCVLSKDARSFQCRSPNLVEGEDPTSIPEQHSERVGQRRHLWLPSKHRHQRALALAVALGLCFSGCGRGAPEQRPAPLQGKAPTTMAAPPVSQPTHDAPAIAVLAEGELRLFDAKARALKSLPLANVASPLLRCLKGTVLVLTAKVWGKLVLDANGSDISWSKISAEPKGCANAVEIRDAVPSTSGGLCLSLSDGFGDTASCEQSYELDPSNGRLDSGCQISEFEATGTTIASPSGRYRVEFRDPAEGDEAYFRSVHVTDREGERSLKFEAQSLLQRDARVEWLPGERAVVIPGRLLTLPALQVVSEGVAACVLR